MAQHTLAGIRVIVEAIGAEAFPKRLAWDQSR
jgi:hypothetical protein